jgi:hypothetical protein
MSSSDFDEAAIDGSLPGEPGVCAAGTDSSATAAPTMSFDLKADAMDDIEPLVLVGGALVELTLWDRASLSFLKFSRRFSIPRRCSSFSFSGSRFLPKRLISSSLSAPRAANPATEVIEEDVPLLELSTGVGGVAAFELERSQLNGDRLTGGGVGCAGVDCAGTLEDDRKADDKPLALDCGGAVTGGAGGLAFAAAEPVELPDDRENLFVIDSTNDGVCGGGGGEGGAASAGKDEALDGGSSSIRETSSSEATESLL